MVRRTAVTLHDIEIADMDRAEAAVRAKRHVIERVPSIMIEGQLASRCTSAGPDEAVLRTALGR